MFAFSSDKQFRLALMIFPAVEKSRSDDTEVTGIPKYFRETFDRAGYFFIEISTTGENLLYEKFDSHPNTPSSQQASLSFEKSQSVIIAPIGRPIHRRTNNPSPSHMCLPKDMDATNYFL